MALLFSYFREDAVIDTVTEEVRTTTLLDAQLERLDALVAERAASIAANSRAAVAAMKKLYGLAQEGRALEAALEAELALEFPEIEDTSERLAGF